MDRIWNQSLTKDIAWTWSSITLMVLRIRRANQCSSVLSVSSQDLKGSTFRRRVGCSGVLSGMPGDLTVLSAYRWLRCIAIFRKLIQRCQGDIKGIAGILGPLGKVMIVHVRKVLSCWSRIKRGLLAYRQRVNPWECECQEVFKVAWTPYSWCNP